MDSSKFKKFPNKKHSSLINEESDFIPFLSSQCAYLMISILDPVTITSKISNGIIYISNPFPEKDKEQKLILLYKESEENKYFKKAIITLEPQINVKNFIKELSKKNIGEILNQKEYKIKIFGENIEKEKLKKEDENDKLKKMNKILVQDNKIENEKIKIKKEDENDKLKKLNEILTQENNELKKAIKRLNEEKEYMRKKLEENESQKEKNKLFENDNLNKKNQNYSLQNNDLNQNIIISGQPGEKIISVLFLTMGSQDIMNYSMPCKTTDLFVDLEKKLYIDFPKYKNYETYFTVNTRRIKRFKTIEENKIKSNDIISLFVIEE